MNILFVCTGNISRSFLAEMLLKNELRNYRFNNISVSSAGTFAYTGRPADEEMIDFLFKKGIAVENHESRPLSREDVDQADLILVMGKEHLEFIEDQWPLATSKVEFLAGYISPDQAEDDIIDPYGGSPYHYRLAQSQITLAVKSLAKKLLAINQTSPNA